VEGGYSEHVECEPVGSFGAEPSVVSRGKAPGQGSGGKAPEAEQLLVIIDSNSIYKNIC
jgi:hypothetical protein